jgi:hypothetical protein
MTRSRLPKAGWSLAWTSPGDRTLTNAWNTTVTRGGHQEHRREQTFDPLKESADQ